MTTEIRRNLLLRVLNDLQEAGINTNLAKMNILDYGRDVRATLDTGGVEFEIIVAVDPFTSELKAKVESRVKVDFFREGYSFYSPHYDVAIPIVGAESITQFSDGIINHINDMKKTYVVGSAEFEGNALRLANGKYVSVNAEFLQTLSDYNFEAMTFSNKIAIIAEKNGHTFLFTGEKVSRAYNLDSVYTNRKGNSRAKHDTMPLHKLRFFIEDAIRNGEKGKFFSFTDGSRSPKYQEHLDVFRAVKMVDLVRESVLDSVLKDRRNIGVSIVPKRKVEKGIITMIEFRCELPHPESYDDQYQPLVAYKIAFEEELDVSSLESTRNSLKNALRFGIVEIDNEYAFEDYAKRMGLKREEIDAWNDILSANFSNTHIVRTHRKTPTLVLFGNKENYISFSTRNGEMNEVAMFIDGRVIDKDKIADHKIANLTELSAFIKR